jgi:WD40 repeat protein
MISKDLLLAGNNNKISVINVNSHNIIRTINSSDSSSIYTICKINENQLLTGDDNHKIKQWKIEGDNLVLISTKENAHNNRIYTILKIRDNHILTGDSSGEEKIW